jgi:hypothetical protein
VDEPLDTSLVVVHAQRRELGPRNCCGPLNHPVEDVVEVMLSRQLERIRQQGIETANRITGHASPASIRQRHRVGDRTGDPRTAACSRGP